MPSLEHAILAAIADHRYKPLKPKVLARKLRIDDYDAFKIALKKLLKQGRIELGKSQTIQPAGPLGTIVGAFRKTQGGFGFVRPQAEAGKIGPDIYIPQEAVGDASTGDEVQVRITKKTTTGKLGPRGQIVRVVARATRNFVGVYFEREGESFVRVDGNVFSHSIFVGDPGAKGAKPDDKVVLEMVRFPSPEERGEGVIVEILGPKGKPGVDTLSIIRALGLPDEFPEDVLEEARLVAKEWDEKNLTGREDFTDWLTITIDPVTARDFDDAISLTQDTKSKHWILGVHIADVGHFAPLGSALDREARKRATSVYLPQRVLPMFPEILSNGLASLQEGKTRFVKSAIIEYTAQGQVVGTRFANGVIRTTKRFAYEQVSEILGKPKGTTAEDLGVLPEVLDLLHKGRELAMILHARRLKRGSLELSMPEVELEYDNEGKVSGGHFRVHDVSHQIIEEFMLAANEAVATALDEREVYFLRRVHPSPDETKLETFAEFVRILGYKVKRETDRFTLQRVLQQSAERPEKHAVHYALLRSLKQAKYSPEKDDHFALAMENYCHFTSPIRRYPDLTVHRQLDQLIKRGRVSSNFDEMTSLGDHCSKMERRAETAERELVKHKMLVYMSSRIGTQLSAIVTGVADYGFYAQAEDLPVEGLVHISNLPDDYYYFEDASYSLVGQRLGKHFRLGDKVKVEVVRVDLTRRQMDFRVISSVARTVPPLPPQERRPKNHRRREEDNGSADRARKRKGKRRSE
ncbi:MAG: ribonuclease R [Gemmataceae bacterium]|nr:ribonuclease R [Gemmataceae bacterium]